MQSPNWARSWERNLFGGLLGMLAAALGARLLILVIPLPGIVLVMMSMLGAAAGMFVAHYGSKSAESVAASFEAWNDWIRRFSLKVMLWMLALAAAIGVLTVLTASYDTLGRLAGTVIATSITAGLLWPMSALADRKDTQASGILGMSATLLVYLMVIPLIWDLDRQDEEMVISSLVIGLTTPAGMFFLALKNNASTWLAARVGVGAYVVVLACFLVATWQADGYRLAGHWWTTGWLSALYGSLAFACLTGMPAIRLDWRWLGVLVAVFTWTLSLIEVWGEKAPDEKLLVVLTSIPIVFGHASLTLLANLTAGQHWLRMGTIASMIVGALFFDLEVINETRGIYGIGVYGRFAGAGGILAACGSLAVLICAKLNGPDEPVKTMSDMKTLASVQITCPRCGKRQALELGGAPCVKCGLVMHIEVSLPAGETPQMDASPFRVEKL